jgi:hypothetical protein
VSDAAPEAAPGSAPESAIESAIEEVIALHAVFEAWLGAGPAEGMLERIADAFDPCFHLVKPDGRLLDRDAVMRWLSGARGERGPGLRIAAEEVRALPSPGPGLSLVAYLERQWTARGETARRSVALLRDGTPPRWLFVGETWITPPRP